MVVRVRRAQMRDHGARTASITSQTQYSPRSFACPRGDRLELEGITLSSLVCVCHAPNLGGRGAVPGQQRAGILPPQ
eukprot:5211484-Prymnesium_polylepis.1